jgi:ureidoglycolate lyase
MVRPSGPKLGAPPIEFFRDMALLDLAGKPASFSVCRVEKRPPVIDVSEYHTGCGEGALPLDGDILMHVGPATASKEPPLSEIEVFLVPKGTFVAIRPGVWHHAAFAHRCKAVNVLIVLPERTYANDCIVAPIGKPQQIRIR